MPDDMVGLEQQGRKAYFYWPLLLILKQKRLQNALHEAGFGKEYADKKLTDSEALQLLRRLGLPLANEADTLKLAVSESLAGVRFWFRCGMAFDDESAYVLDFVRVRVDGIHERRELLRMSSAHCDYITAAATRFNSVLGNDSDTLVFNASRLWALMHGAIIQDWMPVAAYLVREGATGDPGLTVDSAPPPRQRRLNMNGKTNIFANE